MRQHLRTFLRSDCPARIRSSGKRLKRISTSEFSKCLNGQQSPKLPSPSGLSGFEEGEAENSTDNLRNQSQSARSVRHRFLLDVSEAKHLRLTHFALGFSCHTPKAKDIATPRRAALPAMPLANLLVHCFLFLPRFSLFILLLTPSSSKGSIPFQPRT